MFSSNASQVSSDANFIEDVFSTYLYTGNGSTQTINNGIDLAGKGGLVWVKSRTGPAGPPPRPHALFDTARGASQYLTTSGGSGGTGSQLNLSPGGVSAFNANGFALYDDASSTYAVNGTNFTYASWTFRKQPKFFDVVTYTGNGGVQSVAHSLGSVPGCIIVKPVSASGGWPVYHRSINIDYPSYLNTTAAATGPNSVFGIAPTSTQFYVWTSNETNQSGVQYVAYLFAHDAGGFGLSGNENVVSCGTYTGNGSATGPVVTLGYEPQWLMIKRSSAAGNWVMLDVMRGFSDSSDNELYADLALEEGAGLNLVTPLATGFQLQSSTGNINGAGSTYIYIAIRRGPMKVPTLGTKVFAPNARTGNASTQTVSGLSFSPDLWLTKNRGNTQNNWAFDRLRGSNQPLSSNLTNDEETNIATYFGGSPIFTPTNTGFKTIFQSEVNTNSGQYIDLLFGRAPSFFDEVCYTGTGAARTVAHNLAAVPELMIVKRRDAIGSWITYSSATGNTAWLRIDSTGVPVITSTAWNDTTPTSTVFTVGTGPFVNASSSPFVAYLFATCAGVSKVANYTGTGTTQSINCGFTAGARFVMIKRTDSDGDWYVWDSARGIVAGNDPYLLLNSTAAEVTSTDYIDPSSAGFEISSTAPAAINASGGSYIFLAVA